ncbi:MAG: autotransporter assembly complex family protein [Methylophilus sp.]|uniref:autotransporter assembly complex protein TamA n=1 Tax=Methylophilus sp. TaxID=29541 RepID=UPI002C8737D1|nr:autotransporter assembly complex family protein [Methylophilus sp.]HSH87915.1 autotransporter assembly complex family protein [Methylophilus sp.]
MPWLLCLITPTRYFPQPHTFFYLLLTALIIATPLAMAQEKTKDSDWFQVKQGNTYQTRFSLNSDTPPENKAYLGELLEKHLTLHESMQNPRMNEGEWRRLIQKTPQEINDLLATEGYFKVKTVAYQPAPHIVEFHVHLPPQAKVSKVSVLLTGEIQQPAHKEILETASKSWPLQVNNVFTQQAWTAAKRDLLASLLQAEFPNAKITQSQAMVQPLTQEVSINIAVDSGPAVRFGKVNIHGLQHYPETLIRPLNTIKAGDPYRQSELLLLQNSFMSTGKFSQVDVVANTQALNSGNTADVDVTVREMEEKSVRIGVGASTNTGARTVFNYTDRNLFNRGLLWDSSIRLEQRLQAATSNINFLMDEKGYRDSIQNSLTRTDLQGQITTALQNGVRRYWGQPRKFEQFIGANLLYEYLQVDEVTSQFNKAATVTYGFNLRQLDHQQAPTKGWILNTQFQLSPFERISDGRFLQSQARAQAFYPLTSSTQWLGRLEVGSVNGSASKVPATYLFRAGGDQSVRGYGFQSLGVNEGGATVGGRVLLTGSSEIVQWLTPSWGAAVFVDFGNAANSWKDYDPVLGYGLGARFRSPIGPVGVDIAYGEETKEYRLHFNLGVNF